MKKIVILISLIALLSSCGSGGGSGATPQTSGVTPQIPNIPQNPGISTPPTVPRTSEIPPTGQDQAGQNNNPRQDLPRQNLIPQNPTNPSISNQFEKPTDNKAVGGKGVKIGVLDSDFLSENAYTRDFHKGPLNFGTKFSEVLNEEFGERFMIEIGRASCRERV